MKQNTPKNLKLLKIAVAAKVAYWDAEGALEKSLVGNDEDELDDLGEEISFLASCYDKPTDITSEHLHNIIEQVMK